MSYDIALCKNEEPVTVARHADGGTYALGGTTYAELNVTYNYGKHYYQHLDEEKGLRWLYGKTGAETVERLELAVKALGTEQVADYWNPTPGNAGYALNILLGWAKQHPDAVWDGD